MVQVHGPLFSVDDHIIDQPDAYVSRVPERLRDRAPRMVFGKDEHWEFDGERLVTYGAGLESAAGRDPLQWRMDPAFRLDEMRPGCHDPKARLADMDLDGVAVQTLFPSSIARFVGDRFLHHPDKDLSLHCIRAYNDFMLEVWRGEDPDRFVPVMLLPLWDPTLAANEVLRTVGLGAKTVAGAMQLHNLGYPRSFEAHWDPLWSAIAETGIPVSCHSHTTSTADPSEWTASVVPGAVSIGMSAMQATAEMLFTPQLFERWPTLQFLVTEGGIGWVPYLLERADWAWEVHRHWIGMGADAVRPRDTFRQHFTVCFIDDRAGLALRDAIGTDRITFESDYPHTDTSWPSSRQKLELGLAGCTDAEVDAISHGNAERLFKHVIPARVAERVRLAADRIDPAPTEVGSPT